MGWFIKNKRRPGWLALGWHEDSIDLVHVARGADGKPAVALCESFRTEGSQTFTLKRLRKTHRLDEYRCTTLLPGAQYQLHHLEAPAVPDAELKAAVRWRVKDVIDYPLEAAAIDVVRIPDDPDAPPREPSLYAVTARSEAVAACMKPFEEAQVPVQAVDIPDLAQRNVAALLEREGSAVAMLAFYADASLLTFVRGGELLLSRRIEVRADELTDEDAARREQTFQRVSLEAQRSLDHFEYQFRTVPVSRLVVAPLARDVGLTAHISSAVGIAVDQVDLASVIDVAAAPELKGSESQAHYLPLIGAALRSEAQAGA